MGNKSDLIEFQTLSEDRRRAIEIFFKGYLISIGILAVGLKFLIDTKNPLLLITIGDLGIFVSIFASFYWKKSRGHNEKIYNRLNTICKKYDFAPIISTNYIFNAGFVGGIIITLGWILLFLYKVMDLI